jgi:signal transduction histidine kinase
MILIIANHIQYRIPMPLSRSGLFVLAYIVLVTSVLFPACEAPDKVSNNSLKQQFQLVDSLTVAGKGDTAIKIITGLRPQIKSTDPQITTYYCYLSEYNIADTVAMVVYADSAVNFFANSGNIEKYPDEYFRALIMKGDACFIAKEYSQALEYYDKARKALAKGSCDDGNLATKIAGIYYGQENYREAAKYWAESYRHLEACQQNVSLQKLFFLKQSSLDNAGIAYQKAGMVDSAAYYYNLDLDLINKTDSSKVEKIPTEAARIVLYDNLGGLYLKVGNLAKAADYLTKCIAVPTKDVDGMRIPPFLKQAELYLKSGDLARSEKAFYQSRLLLDRYSKQNPGYEILWNKLYAQYLFTINQPVKAYVYQNTFIRLKDSLDNTNSKLRRIDIEQELNAIHREGLLTEMRHQTKLERLYIGGISIAVLLLIAISLFISRILRESRKNHKETKRQNEQLQQTLVELENANKNFIRIMRIMAHDLRNPLSGMIGLATAILEEDVNEENKHMLQLIETTGLQSLEMINELLKSGLADENEPIVKQALDLKELLGDSVELLQFKANEKQQQIIFECDDQPVITQANYEKIWRVFSNLIVNAIKFSYTGGIIKVSLQADHKQQRVLISVADNGIGIPDKDKDKIFEMFTEAKRTGTDGEQPFGLGLSISKKIIEKHNGKLWFESITDVGTTFFIELPL